MPSGTEYVYSNTTARKSRVEGSCEVVVFGTQYFVEEYLVRHWNEEFFGKPIEQVLAEYHRIIDNHLGPNVIDDEKIKYLHSLGYLPIRLKALPEGTLCPIGVPHMTIVNTDPKCAWLTNFLETISQTVTWMPLTSATTAFRFRRMLNAYAAETSDCPDFVQWQGHDFSMRGMSSAESSAVSGAAHALSFTGSDSIPCIPFLEKYYGADVTKELIVASVTASEHSIASAHFDSGDGNEDAYIQNMLDAQKEGIVSIVSDTYDYWKMITENLPRFKDQIMGRNGKLVVRPDCYDNQTEILTNSGWKFFKDLTEEDLVAQVLDNGSREFVKPLEIINQKYSGKMNHFKDFHGKVDLLVTPNHRMVILQDGKERIVEAAVLGRYGNHKQKMIRSASAKSNPTNHLTYLERLKIAFQADGSFQTDCGPHKIRFKFTKQRKIDRLTHILDYLGLEYKIYNLYNGQKEFNVTLNDNDFTKDFTWVDVNSVTKEWSEEFIEECSYWDACRRSDDRFKFDTTILSVANTVEFIALSAGYGVLKTSYEDIRDDKYLDIITLNILKDNTVGGQSWEKTEINYDGTVHCVKVPSGKVFVRRNRCTIISGNSGDPIKIVTGYFVREVNKTLREIKSSVGSMSGYMATWIDDTYDCVKTSDGYYVGQDFELLTEAEVKGSIQVLFENFGGVVNSKGYVELDSHIGLIYGDSITYERCQQICERLKRKGFASTNVVYGIGSYTYQYVTRDTYSLACKATWVRINGKPKNIFKDPKTGDGMKKSAKGLLVVNNQNGTLVLKNECSPEEEQGGELKTVFENGRVLVKETLSGIRARLHAAF